MSEPYYSETYHPAWRSILAGYPLPASDELVWGWNGKKIQKVVLHDENSTFGGHWMDLEDHHVGAISHWMPVAENPDQPPRPSERWAVQHDTLAEPPHGSAFVWAFMGDLPPHRAQYIDGHWHDLDGLPLDPRGLKWLRESEFADLAWLA